MRVYGIPPEAIRRIVGEVSSRLYESNLDFVHGPDPKGRAQDFRLRVVSSRGPGHRLSHSRTSRGNQRHLVAACWHVWRDVLYALFDEFPDARCQSAIADYRGARDFETKFPVTGIRNIGSMMYPLQMQEACDCVEDGRYINPVRRFA